MNTKARVEQSAIAQYRLYLLLKCFMKLKFMLLMILKNERIAKQYHVKLNMLFVVVDVSNKRCYQNNESISNYASVRKFILAANV